MNKIFQTKAFDDYLHWQTQDKKTLKKINELVKDIKRNGEGIGIGQPEALKHKWSGYWSRRIDKEHRLVYRINEENHLYIASCKGHY